MGKMITVGIADINIAKTEDVLVTYALGSCVGICLYDSQIKLAGLAHIMLPSSTQLTNVTNQPYKFADTGIKELLKMMNINGANPTRLRAKIAGGAQMFAAMSNSSIANIGDRNVSAVKQWLAMLRIPIVAEDTGKDYGRTLFFDAATGTMRIKSAKLGEWTF
ncbi:MAG: chemotaxis protein CheD [Oscillospiraceae bacterium]|jgi:chemotaxis protein CheD|nr:chemotaxis protein CheD [Oscillospiraceae bacterium]